jgi:CRISPR-associated protein Cmr2
MRFDLYAELASQAACPTDGSPPAALASWFVDGCTEWSARGIDQRNDARRQYLQRASSLARTLELPKWLQLDPQFERLPDSSWLAFDVTFALERPWYSKDDRPFHVLDNPVRKDRVFGLPYLAAASWKGLLRWACRMQAGLLDYLERHGGKFDGWPEPAWVAHLFGNESGDGEDFQRGALAFYPSWFSRIGVEVINPHSRRVRAGTQPIAYEVVPAGTEGTLRLLYVPLPSTAARNRVKSGEAIEHLLEAIEALLTTYGISAKRTVGWGTAMIQKWRAFKGGRTPIEQTTLHELKGLLRSWLAPDEETP